MTTENVSGMLTLIKAFILINIVWMSDKIILFSANILSISAAENFFREFNVYINSITSACILILTIMKLIRSTKKKEDEE